jgi:penicillin G amidase
MKIVKRLSGILFILVVLGLGGAYFYLQRSLPILEGNLKVKGLDNPVTVERDLLGIPTLYASNRKEIACSLGFLHAQDRFFQMDLMRRAAAGEIAELFGKQALDFDKKRRLHRFRSRAKLVISQLSLEEQQLLNAYTLGVNEGVKALKAYPFEYLFLGTKPKSWLPEDSLLVCFGLFFELQDPQGESSAKKDMMKKLLPQEVFNFFVNNGSKWEAALDNSKRPLLPIPDRNAFSYLSKDSKSEISLMEPGLRGSNQWAVTKNKSHNGKAILACDMHLRLSVPHIWYRAAFSYKDEKEQIRIDGITLPGLPLMIVGSNTHIAWGFTNSFVETSEIVAVDPAQIEKKIEFITIKDEKEPYTYEIQEANGQPVLPSRHFGQPVAVHWIAYDPSAINLRLTHLEKAKSVSDALQLSKTIRVPSLNFMVVDTLGNIAWTLIGSTLHSDPLNYPSIVNPADHHLWTANNRTLADDRFNPPSTNSFINGIRAYQIKDNLSKLQQATPEDMLALQMNIEAPFFERWQRLMIESLENGLQTEKRKALLETLRGWNKLADSNSAAYYYIRLFRKNMTDAILQRTLHPCLECKPDFLTYFHDFEEPVWQILSNQPSHLRDINYQNWNDEFLKQMDDMLLAVEIHQIEDQQWGKENVLTMKHPFSGVIPGVAYFLDMPPVPMSGDYYVPKVAYCNDGASQRMVISPGLEKDGIFHMPAGQSAHPLSPFYCAGHKAWLEGSPSSFLPGKPLYKLELLPEESRL